MSQIKITYRQMDWLALWPNQPAARLRNFLVERAPGWLRDRQMDWILNYNVPSLATQAHAIKKRT